MAVDAEEGRRRREDNMVEIRKNKREENLLKKRREGLQGQQFQPTVNVAQLDKKVTSVHRWLILLFFCCFCFLLLLVLSLTNIRCYVLRYFVLRSIKP